MSDAIIIATHGLAVSQPVLRNELQRIRVEFNQMIKAHNRFSGPFTSSCTQELRRRLIALARHEYV
jgi:hypothetical protein